MSSVLNEKQSRVYNFLLQQSNTGVPPTVREICNATGIKSTSSVHAILLKLENLGYIDRGEKTSRSVRIKGAVNAESVPVLGTITAGVPILAVENVEEYIPVDASIVDNKQLFALRVKGESMIGAGILDGDYVICARANDAENHDIVVALIEDEATVKRFIQENGKICLMPENEAFDPIYPETVQILGRVIALYRKF